MVFTTLISKTTTVLPGGGYISSGSIMALLYDYRLFSFLHNFWKVEKPVLYTTEFKVVFVSLLDGCVCDCPVNERAHLCVCVCEYTCRLHIGS